MKQIKNGIKVCKKIFWILSKEQKLCSILILALSIVGAVLETLGVSIILPLVSAMLEPEKFLNNSIITKSLKFINISEPNQIVVLIGGATICLYIFKNVYFIFLAWARIKFAYKVQRELSIDVMESFMTQGYSYFLTKSIGELHRGVGNDISGVYNILTNIFKVFVEAITIGAICIFIMCTDPIMAGSILILATICLATIYLYFKTSMKRAGTEQQRCFAILNQVTIQAFQGIKEILVNNRQNYFVDLYKKCYVRQQKAGLRQTMGNECPSYVIEAICVTGLMGIVCLKIITNINGAENMIPALSAFTIGAFRILPSLGRISSSINVITFNLPCLEVTYKNIKVRREYIAKKDKKDQYNKEINTKRINFQESLIIKNVFYKYESGESDVLKNVNLKISKGESVAFVGPSGAGKTTLADIILGLLSPQKGKIMVDGKDILYLKGGWNELIGYVPQNIYLTNDTLRKNIAFGIAEQEIDDKKIWKALGQAHLKELIENLPEKLDTEVGERGIRFSGGQRQRIAIARALYNDPDILVLDEATAALDNETEAAVMESIDALQKEKTLIIIAHRLSTIKNCDKIYEVKNGGVEERSYEELVYK